eukprot:860746-Rhodomonas_salina.1
MPELTVEQTAEFREAWELVSKGKNARLNMAKFGHVLTSLGMGGMDPLDNTRAALPGAPAALKTMCEEGRSCNSPFVLRLLSRCDAPAADTGSAALGSVSFEEFLDYMAAAMMDYDGQVAFL